MVKQLLLVRHASTGPAHAGRYVGRSDLELGPDGLREAEGLAAAIRCRRPARCFSSPLARAAQMARAIAEPAGLADVRTATLATIDLFDGRGVLSGLNLTQAAGGR